MTNNSENRLPTELLTLRREILHNPMLDRMAGDDRRQFEQVLSGARELEEIRERFWNMLVTQLKDIKLALPNDRKVEVLDIACGKADEAMVLNSFFGNGKFGNRNDRVNVTAIDVNTEAIEHALSQYKESDFSKPITTFNLPTCYKFINGDATRLDEYSDVPKEADVVIIRHQQISNNAEIWTKIFKQALSRLNVNGVLMVTSFSDLEHRMLLEALAKLDCEIVHSGGNNYAKPLNDKEISVDRNVAIIRKKK